jgi:Ca-activated chloride channel family protein
VGDFHFLRPWWLAALPVGIWLIYRLLKGRTDAGGWGHVVDAPLRAYVLAAPEILRESRWPLGVALAAWVLALVALAGPAWERLPVPAFRSEEALVVALDLSRSMDATDVEPSRLARAKLKLLDLLDRRTAGQTALVVFTTHAFTVTPLTTDNRTIASLVNSVSTDIMPSQGSSVRSGLKKAAELLKQTGLGSGDILVISDADVTDDDLDAARDLSANGFNVHVLAVGTEQGAPIGLPSGGFLTDNDGKVVIPKLDAAGLKQLADAGGGRFARLTPDDRDLATLFPTPAAVTSNAVVKKDDQEHKADVWRDNGLWFAVGLLPLLALAFRRGWICVLLISVLLPLPRADAFEWQSLWRRADQRGYEALQSQDAKRAAELFRDPRWRGAAQYRAGDYAASASTLASLDTAEAHYNRGNALAKAGHLEDAVSSYDRALELDPKLDDARYNRDLLKDYLKKHPQQQQANQQQNGQRDNQSQHGGSQNSKDGGDRGEQQSRPDRPNDASKGDQQKSADSSAGQNQRPGSDSTAGEKDAQAKADGQKADREQPKDGESQDSAKAAPAPQDVDKWASEQAAEQWLRRVPQDPGGLLRRKFLYQYQRLGIDQDGKAVGEKGGTHPW